MTRIVVEGEKGGGGDVGTSHKCALDSIETKVTPTICENYLYSLFYISSLKSCILIIKGSKKVFLNVVDLSYDVNCVKFVIY